jgi:alkanesulfonate monooxygenase SsuD/methylene tetrahydromethanopterin reductase-like flavin-dependent oxidoreductase (luciferase family)
MRAFKEACEIISRMWTEDEPVFEGEFYTIDKPINEPKGVQKPHPSFWIGGSGEKVTLRLVARWADACNVLGNTQKLKHKFDVLRGHCEDFGRDYEEITRSTGGMSYDEYSRRFMVGTADEISERLQQKVAAGVNYFIIYLPRVAYDPTPVERFAKEVIPNFS